MKSKTQHRNWERERLSPRIHTVKEVSVHYEGHSEEVALRPPDVSTHGMFFNTATRFPEGAVLNLRFRLALSGAEIRTRCEVRYCLPGVGMGVEFIGISPEDVRRIEREIKLCNGGQPRRKAAKIR